MARLYKFTIQVFDRSKGSRVSSGTVEASHVRIAAGRAIKGTSAGATVRLEIATCTASETNAARQGEAEQHRKMHARTLGCYAVTREDGRGCVFCGGATSAADAARQVENARRLGWSTGAASWSRVVDIRRRVEAGEAGAGALLLLAGWVPGAAIGEDTAKGGA